MRRPMLDALRGVAILLVVCYHGLYWGVSIHPWYSQLFRMGYLGVQLFFVLSGFLITGILVRSRERPDYYQRFYWHRALRILPAYLLTIGVLVAVGTIDRRFFLASLLFVTNFVPLQYGPLWSLAVEEQFYACWPSIVRYVSDRAMAWTCVAIVGVVTILRVSLDLRANNFATWFVADGLALGALTALRPSWMRSAWKWGLVLLPLEYFYEFRFLPFELLFASLVLWGATTERVGSRVLRFFGDISYGLYLIHVGISLLVAHWFPGVGILPGFLTAFVIAVTVASVSRWTYEAFFLNFKTANLTTAIQYWIRT